MSEDTDFHKDGRVPVNARKTKPISDSDISYIDFETCIEGTLKETDRQTDLSLYSLIPNPWNWKRECIKDFPVLSATWISVREERVCVNDISSLLMNLTLTSKENSMH